MGYLRENNCQGHKFNLPNLLDSSNLLTQRPVVTLPNIFQTEVLTISLQFHERLFLVVLQYAEPPKLFIRSTTYSCLQFVKLLCLVYIHVGDFSSTCCHRLNSNSQGNHNCTNPNGHGRPNEVFSQTSLTPGRNKPRFYILYILAYVNHNITSTYLGIKVIL